MIIQASINLTPAQASTNYDHIYYLEPINLSPSIHGFFGDIKLLMVQESVLVFK